MLSLLGSPHLQLNKLKSFYSTLLTGTSCSPSVLFSVLLLGETSSEESLDMIYSNSIESQNLVRQGNNQSELFLPIVLTLIYGKASPHLKAEQQATFWSTPKVLLCNLLTPMQFAP